MPSDTRDFLGTGWKFPLQVTPAGGIARALYEQRIEESLERRQRKLRWVSLKTAAELVDDRDLAELLASLADNDGTPLRDFVDAAA